MYGPVNKAICEMMLTGGGPSDWHDVFAPAAVEDNAFTIAEPYDDRGSFALAEASDGALQVLIREFLHNLGHWWIREIARRDHQHVMTASGSSRRSFLFRLPDFHTRVVGIIFHRSQTLKFECTGSLTASPRLGGRSHSCGLSPFLMGMLETLSIHFQTPIGFTLEPQTGAEDRHDVHLIEWTHQ